MDQSNQAVSCLKSMLGTDKFAEDMNGLYTGCPDPDLRRSLNARMDAAIERFIAAAKQGASDEQYLALLKECIRLFDRDEVDSEDADQIGFNFERIMDCVGLVSSEGTLNMWRYGFDPAKLLRQMGR